MLCAWPLILEGCLLGVFYKMSQSYEDLLKEALRKDDPLLLKVIIQGISADIRRRSTPIKLEFQDSKARACRPKYLGHNPFDFE